MNKHRKSLIYCVGIVIVIIVAVGHIVFCGKTSKIEMGQKNAQAQALDLIKQLYSISIPDELDPEAKGFTALKNGKVEVRGPQDLLYWGAYLNGESNYYTIADFNNDGLDDVAIVIGETGGGSGFFYHLVICMNEGGRLKYLTSEYLGDRIKVNEISYASGFITADIITQGPNEGYCCGTMPATLKFRLENNHLIPIK